MRLKVLMFILLVLIICTSGFPGIGSAKQSEPAFELIISPSASVIKVTIKGHDLQDLYAWEMNLEYDAKVLKFSKATAAGTGYSVEPKLEGNYLRLAHTKIGSLNGDDGEVVLTNLEFEPIASGKTEITLHDLKLVDSKLEMAVISPGLQGQFQTTVNFTDIEGHWAEEAIGKALRIGFVEGYQDRTFRPKKEVTRAEFAAMVARALQLENSAEDISFVDESRIPAWAMPKVQSVVKEKLVIGYPDQTFRPDHHITRAEMAAIAVRALGQPSGTAPQVKFADALEIPAWANSFIADAVEEGLMKGTGNNRFSPIAKVTRAEAVAVILNVLEQQAS